MKSLNTTTSFLARIVATMLACFVVQSIVYFGFPKGTGKTESNYFTTVSRFQGAVTPGADIALVGSSISGRLPGRESGNTAIANLGSDGGSPLDGLILLNDGLVGRPKWLVMEINTVFSSLGYPETAAVAGSRGLWFKVGVHLPLLGASARPSGMLYGRLAGQSAGAFSAPFRLQSVTSPVPSNEASIEEFTALERMRIQDLSMALIKAKLAGIHILIVRYPAGPLTQNQVVSINAAVAQLHKDTGAPYLDLSSQIPRSDLIFTDNVHLGPESSARVLSTIRAATRELERVVD